ncbi:MAG: hypothetical protein ACFB00_12180 [Parvularculaceae bacterium]
MTFVAVAAPFLFLSKRRIDRLSGFDGALALYRLYGVAVLALLVGYAGGLVETLGGATPYGVIAMGLVSNAGAAIVLMATGVASRRPLSTGFFGLIAAALGACALFPDAALRPL